MKMHKNTLLLHIALFFWTWWPTYYCQGQHCFSSVVFADKKIPLPQICEMSLCVRKPTVWVSDQVWHKPACVVKENSQKMDCTICVAKTKAQTRFAITAKLVCAFVFAYMQIVGIFIRLLKCWARNHVSSYTRQPSRPSHDPMTNGL